MLKSKGRQQKNNVDFLVFGVRYYFINFIILAHAEAQQVLDSVCRYETGI